MDKLIVVNDPSDWNFNIPNLEVVSTRDYLTVPAFLERKNLRVFNLAKSYKYLSSGYYVSLLAEGRGHKVIPSVTTIQDFKSQNLIKVISDEIEETIQKVLKNIRSDTFTLSIYFGKNPSMQYDVLCNQLYNLFQAPMLRAQFKHQKKWILNSIAPISAKDIPETHEPYVQEFAKEYFSKSRYHSTKISKYNYDLAILHNPKEKAPPSDKKALDKFLDTAEELGMYAELITKEDYNRLPQFDALFIRETTSVNHHTYRFSRRAMAEGLVVIDDPQSILRCANKVYLAEILAKAKIPTPKTIILHKNNIPQAAEYLGFPCVLKRPDSSFSQGVVRAENLESLQKELDEMLKSSDLVIGQSFLPTDYDWRIGILDGKAIFACKYYMAENHWQIYNWSQGKKSQQSGKSETLPVAKVPKEVTELALKSTQLIGDGLYGVDLKQKGKKLYVIEINDNPNIDSGLEDFILKDKLYKIVLQSFKRRLDESKRNVK